MAAFAVTPRAGRDIEDIWDFTADHWNTAQADWYIRNFQEAMMALAANPEKGRACDAIRTGYRKYAVGSHFIFYRATDVGEAGIEIIRVLHQRMNVEIHL
ncbi:MAG: type II toxin-antitoxin system RelE/ParE family toxin [Proteobacteria bacterium]|nr:type II toxin-antitoxin system RelE/ParE family toxin [Pseudomonadota bacterium]